MASNLPAPQNVRAQGFELHVDITWDAMNSPTLERYVHVYRSLQGGEFKAVGIEAPGINRFTDYLGKPGLTARYKVAASDREYHRGSLSSEGGPTKPMSDEELLTMLQEACFRYYWEGAHPQAGMTLENIPGDDRIVATGASGFGIMAIVVGVDRGFITRDQGLERLTKIVTFLEKAPRYHGVWSHFMDGDTGQSLPVFGMFDNAGDLVETAFLMQGLLVARQYFNGGENPSASCTRESHGFGRPWSGMVPASPQSDALYWHWSPHWSWYINHRLTGFNETMIVYLLAIASPTHAVSAEFITRAGPIRVRRSRGTGGVVGFQAGDHYLNGYAVSESSSPSASAPAGRCSAALLLYGFRSARTSRSLHGLLSQSPHRADQSGVLIQNPGHFRGYDADSGGLPPATDLAGYLAHQHPAMPVDDGTRTFTGAWLPFPYTRRLRWPPSSMSIVTSGDSRGRLRSRDAVNHTADWVSPIYMGLNQAPITVMIENYRTG